MEVKDHIQLKRSTKATISTKDSLKNVLASIKRFRYISKSFRNNKKPIQKIHEKKAIF